MNTTDLVTSYFALVFFGMVAAFCGTLVSITLMQDNSANRGLRGLLLLCYAVTGGLIGSLLVSSIAAAISLALFPTVFGAGCATAAASFVARILVCTTVK